MGAKTITAGAGLLALGTTLFIGPTAGATAPPPYLHVTPTTVQAGGALEFLASCYGNRTEVTSPGLAAPVVLEPNSGSGAGYPGQGRAGQRPGHFTASFTCSGGPTQFADGTATAEFTVVCTPVTPSPTSTAPPTTSVPSSSNPPSSEPPSGNPPSSSTPAASPTTSSADVAPAASVSCSAPGSAPAPQVRIVPRGAPETGDGSTAGN